MEIDKVTFGILSPEEILNLAVCEIKEVSKNRFQGENTVYDPRLGPTENGQICKVCAGNQTILTCPGHFGIIRLNHPVINPLHYRLVLQILKCVCLNCYRLMATADILDIECVKRDLNHLVPYFEKNRVCHHCKHIHPKLIMVQDNIIHAVMTSKTGSKIEVHDEEIKLILQSICDDDVRLLGFDASVIHPRNIVISVLPVLPTCNRPSIQTNNIIADDDLTIQYIEIVKINKHIEELNSQKTTVHTAEDAKILDDKKLKYIKSLQFRIKTLQDNSQGKARRVSSGRSYQSIKQRLNCKTGLLRSNLNGKRVNQSGRTVIGPDPLVPITHVVVPEEMARKLTKPIYVNDWNKEQVAEAIDRGIINYIIRTNDDGQKTRFNMKYAIYNEGTKLELNDTIERNGKSIYVSPGNIERLSLVSGDKLHRNGVELFPTKIRIKKQFDLQTGDIAEQQLQNGDWLLINRQPTLHRTGMLAFKATIRPGRTLRINLGITGTFNAD